VAHKIYKGCSSWIKKAGTRQQNEKVNSLLVHKLALEVELEIEREFI
jgi:hypothetical protein